MKAPGATLDEDHAHALVKNALVVSFDSGECCGCGESHIGPVHL